MVKNLLIGKSAAPPAQFAEAGENLPAISVYFAFKPTRHG
jgi:hypothetical protein